MRGLRKIFIPPIVVLIVTLLLAFWSVVRIQRIPESDKLPGATFGVAALIVGIIIAICIVLVTIAGEIKFEKTPAERIVREEKRVTEEVPTPKPAEEKAPPAEVAKPAPPKEKPAEAEEMVVCGGCGALVPASSKVCPNCGAEFEE